MVIATTHGLPGYLGKGYIAVYQLVTGFVLDSDTKVEDGVIGVNSGIS